MKLIKKYWLPILLILLVLPSIWPLFRPGFFRMHDWQHVARLGQLDLALKDGQFPPRWSPDFGWGYGMPLLHFYAPLPYYLAEMFHLLGISAVNAIKLVFGLNYLAGFYFMYLWAKEYWRKLGGVIAATSFVYLPYRAVDFYVRGTLGELTAMTFLPLFFYAAHKLVKEKKPQFVILSAVSLAGIFLSHSPVALFAVFLIFLYFLFYLKSWRQFLLSGLLAFGLSAFFILPAFFEKSYTIVSKIASGFFHYSFHFIYLRQLLSRRWGYGGSVLGIKDNISFQLGLPQTILALLAVIVLFLAIKKKKKALITQLTYVASAFILTVFLMTFHAQSIWDKLTIIQITQFPWRLLVFSSTFIAFLTGSIAYLVTQKKVLLILTALIVFSTIALNLNYFQPEKPDNWQLYTTDKQIIRTEISDGLFDYLPVTAQKPAEPQTDPYQTTAQIDNFSGKTGLYTFTSQADQSTQFYLNQYYFPGWQANLDGQPVTLQPSEDIGRIEFTLPAGQHQVEIKLAKTKLQFWSDIISLVAWLGVGGYLLNKRYV